jgi:hypothetical protein
VPYSAYFATRAEYYRTLAMRSPNRWQTECQLGLANLFLEMSCDMRLRELAVEPAMPCPSNRAGVRWCGNQDVFAAAQSLRRALRSILRLPC